MQRRLIALAANFTAEPVSESLGFWLTGVGLPCDVEHAPFDQVFQQLLDPASLLGANRGGANVILVRLDLWLEPRSGQEGVAVSAVSGVVAPAARMPQRLRADLPSPQAAAAGAVELATGFSTPLAGLLLSTPRDNSLLPVRILGRNEASQPWRLLARTVVYRLGPAGSEATNAPESLHGQSARWLHIESTNGADLAAATQV